MTGSGTVKEAKDKISLNLRMEHMVRLFKLSLKQLGADVNHIGAQRIAQLLEELIRSADKDCKIEKASGYHSSKHLKEVVLQVFNDLKSADVFEVEARRSHNCTILFTIPLIQF